MNISFGVSFSIPFSIGPTEAQTIWDNTDGVLESFPPYPLKVQATGELIYIGTSLHDLTGIEGTEDADYAIKLRVMGTQNLQLDLRARRLDENNFIALKINATTDTISLVETIAGVETTLDSASHDLKHLGRTRYDFRLVMLGEFISGVVNDFSIVSASTTSFRTEPGFSVSIPAFNSADPPLLYTISYTETESFPDPVDPLPYDPGELLITFRRSITQEIENPPERTWATYRRAVLFYEQRNVGMPDETWEALGYPIEKPSAEEWFG